MQAIGRFTVYLLFLAGLLATSISSAAPMDDTVRLLRDQRFIAEDLAFTIKAKYKPNVPEYKEAKRLYENARREYSRFVEEFVFSITHSELKDLKPSATAASVAAKEFQVYVSTKTKTLGGPLAGVLELGDGILKAAEGISKEIREWFVYYKSQRKELAEDLGRLLTWKDWDKLS